MTSYVENETEFEFPFEVNKLVDKLMEVVLTMENCQYEACVNLLITNNEGIREFNRDYRDIDKETDVLSFPNVPFETEGDFQVVEEQEADCFDPDSGELILGDIIISVDRVLSQAEEYGHSILREFAFLTSHSLFHLCGYDHMVEEEAKRMEQKQEEALQKLGITRDVSNNVMF